MLETERETDRIIHFSFYSRYCVSLTSSAYFDLLRQGHLMQPCLCYTPVHTSLSTFRRTRIQKGQGLLRWLWRCKRWLWRLPELLCLKSESSLFSFHVRDGEITPCFLRKKKKWIEISWNNFQFTVWFSLKCQEVEILGDSVPKHLRSEISTLFRVFACIYCRHFPQRVIFLTGIVIYNMPRLMTWWFPNSSCESPDH